MKLLIRAVVTWAVTSLAVILFAGLIPGVHIARWQSSLVIVLILGILNAVVRPLVLALALNLGLIFFALITFLLDVFIVLFAARVLPGFAVDGFWSAVLLSFLLAIANTLCTGWLSSDDDDTFLRSVVQRIARRHPLPSDSSTLGTVIVQIDGLAEPVLRSEIATGRLPTLERWIGSGTHRLVPWNCGVPSMTPGSQAGILNGNNANIPAFRWYERDLGRLVVANHPKDARWIDQRQSTDHGLLQAHGSSISNIFSGGAEHQVMTQSGLVNEQGKVAVASSDFYSFLVSPYSLFRLLVGMLRELGLEYWQAWRQRRKRVEPRMHRGGAYPLLRAATNVLMADATTYVIIDDMFRGRSMIYADYLGYDEIAHHAGPDSQDARRSLRNVDRRLHALELAARSAKRRYEFVVLSDHGQSTGATFRQRYGYTLADLVNQLVEDRESVAMAGGQGEGWSHLNILLSEILRAGGIIAKTVRTILPRNATRDSDEVNLGPDAKAEEDSSHSDAVVCASGNLALIYFTDGPSRLSREALDQRYPRLLPSLLGHPGIGFLLLESESQGPIVLSASGSLALESGAVVGDNPLEDFDPSTARYLHRLAQFSNAPDILVNSPCDPETGQVSAYEELIGCHGGAGGLQTRPFLLFPTAWTDEHPEISGPEALHEFLREHCVSIQAGTGPVIPAASPGALEPVPEQPLTWGYPSSPADPTADC